MGATIQKREKSWRVAVHRASYQVVKRAAGDVEKWHPGVAAIGKVVWRYR